MQFYKKVKQDIPDLDSQIKEGNFSQLLDWLRKNIHQKGRLLRADDLVKEVTGKSLDEDIFIDYINDKFRKLYGI